jgi:hypothetical protein
MEQTLAADAETRGWVREVERHELTADRIRSLLPTWANPSKPIVRNGVADVDCGQVTVTPGLSRGRGSALRLPS